MAFLAVWLIWPALYVFAQSISLLGDVFNGALPLPTRIAIKVIQWNSLFLPSVVGTAILVVISRLAKSSDDRGFLCHLLTLSAFVLTILTMACFATFLRT